MPTSSKFTFGSPLAASQCAAPPNAPHALALPTPKPLRAMAASLPALGACIALFAFGCSSDAKRGNGEAGDTGNSPGLGDISIGGGESSGDGEGGNADASAGADTLFDADQSDDGMLDGVTSGPDGAFCLPNSTACVGDRTVGVCNADGSAFEPTDCGDGQGCLAGECIEQICTPGEKNGLCTGPSTYGVCNGAGTQFVAESCPGGQTCFEGECTNLICAPASTVCAGLSAYSVCKGDGSGFEGPFFCEEGQLCDNQIGKCVDACAANSKANVYVGCDYFAVDLDNIEGGQAAPVGVVVSVPATETKSATIKIVDTSTNTALTAEQLAAVDANLQPSLSLKVEPGQLKVFSLPVSAADNGAPLNGSVKKRAAYRITSDTPVTVHQFNPLNGEGVFTNDASLLLPSNLGGTEYIVLSWPQRVIADADAEDVALRGFATVIATEPGTTTVEVYARGRIGGGIGVPTILPNQSHTFSLEEGEVLNLETDGDTGADLTGTWIRGSQRVTVFGGHECANVPISVSYCDHVEQQLIPVDTWGSTYIADAFKSRNEHQFDLYRVVGGRDNITVSTNPPIPGFENFTLHKGAFVELQAKGSFAIEATGPILVGHYMVGSNYPGFAPVCETATTKSGIGDPAMTIAIPTQQYLTSYVVLTPPGYEENYLNIIGPEGVQVTLDGAPLAVALTPVGNTGYSVAQVPVTTGVHAIESTGGAIGVTAYGYDCDVSYAYPGGLKLESFDL